MDKKKKISMACLLALGLMLGWAFPAVAQDADEVSAIQLCGRSYENEVGKDTITLYLKVIDGKGRRSTTIEAKDLEDNFNLNEDGTRVARERWKVETLIDGQRIPSDYTISVLVDLSIPAEGKQHIYEAVSSLVDRSSDSCVFISFFGDAVGKSELINKKNKDSFKSQFQRDAHSKFFYSALYAKLTEFNFMTAEYEDSIISENGYDKNWLIHSRAQQAPGKNLLFVFTQGNEKPDFESAITFIEVTDYQNKSEVVAPRVYAFFYDTGNGIDYDMEQTLMGVTNPHLAGRTGTYKSSTDMNSVVENFEEAYRNEMYDFALTYRAAEDKNYKGAVEYQALWGEDIKGEATYSIGTTENPWPKRIESTGESIAKYLIALLVTLLTILLFVVIIKIVIPGVKSKAFSMKYYKRYKPQENVKRTICYFCRREIDPGEMVVMRCKHIMHTSCWKENDYKCAEYGQNCKDGIQEHVHWKELLSVNTLRDCLLTIMGICAGLVSWIIFEFSGRKLFEGLSRGIANSFLSNGAQHPLVNECTTKVSAFLAIGLLLAFFLSLIFRYNDGVRKKDWKSLLKITGLSLLSGAIGMAAFILGAIILCMWLSPTAASIPWYVSLPAYLLFSVCTSLSLTIKSSIPFKSALLGGLASAVIGFIVLYFSNSRWSWMNMLLDFVIYGGGLGASLVTVRMLSEKYFLVIKNGVREGVRIPIHKWMNATGGGNKVTIGMTERCEIQMTWEKSNKVAKEHVQLYVNHERSQAMMKPLAPVLFNARVDLPANKAVPLSNGDLFKVGETIFQYVES